LVQTVIVALAGFPELANPMNRTDVFVRLHDRV
jgi:hypothetical protein